MKTPWIGGDLGMGALKFYGARGATQLVSQVSVNGVAKMAHVPGLKTITRPLHIAYGAQSFFVGPRSYDWGRPVEALDYERLIGSPEIKALLYGAFTQYHLGDTVNLVVGLPHEIFTPEHIPAVKRALLGAHTWQADDAAQSVMVEQVKVTTQAYAAWQDMFLLDDGSYNAALRFKPSDEIGVISLGFNTVELLGLRAKQVVPRFTGGKTVGVRRLLELANPRGLYALGELDAQLRAGQLDTSEAMETWQREVNGFIEHKWGAAWQRFARVIAVGGGAVLLQDALHKKFAAKLYIPDDPVHAIARGLYKTALSEGW